MNFDDIIKQIKTKYINDLAIKIEKLTVLVENKDFTNLEKFFHQLKGSGASYGFPEFSEFGAKYEQKIKEKTLTNGEINGLSHEFSALYKKHRINP